MYVAHIMLFLLFTAQIARTVRKFDNPMYEDEFNVHNFLQHPDVLIGQALTLRYKPVDLDVLPLYISLIAVCPLVLWCMVRRPNWTLLGSILLYIGARIFDWNFASYPPGTHWYFNPFAWQLMFFFAAWCGVGGVKQLEFVIQSRAALAVAFAWMAFAFFIVMTWHSSFLESLVPKWMIKAIYPIDKTDLDMLRFTHFLALALVVSRFFPRKTEILDLQMAASDGAVRSAFAAAFLLRRIPVVWSALLPGAVLPRTLGATVRQLRRHGDHDRAGMAAGSGRKGPHSVRRFERVSGTEGGVGAREGVIPGRHGGAPRGRLRRPEHN